MKKVGKVQAINLIHWAWKKSSQIRNKTLEFRRRKTECAGQNTGFPETFTP